MRKFLVALIVFFLFTNQLSQGVCLSYPINSKEGNEIYSSVSSFLSEAAYSQYNMQNSDYLSRSILKIAEHDKDKITETLKGYPTFRRSLPDLEYDEGIYPDDFDSFEKNLLLFEKINEYYSFLNDHENCDYRYLDLSYGVVNEKNNGVFAIMLINELAEFQYGNVSFSSSLLTCYCVSLVKFNDEWLILSVESDNEIYQCYHDNDFDLEKAINGVLAADLINQDTGDRIENDDTEKVSTALTSPSSVNWTYIRNNAANYGLTYSVTNDNLTTPSFRNNRFCYNNHDCVRFASQCMWAGFDGSNDSVDIAAKRAMDTTGSYVWYEGSTPSAESASWKSTASFKSYIEGVRDHASEDGVHCITNTVEYNSNDLVGTSGLNTSNLLGAILLVKGGNGNDFGHAVVITQANGPKRTMVYYSAYNVCAKNVLLSSKHAASTTDQHEKIFVASPQYIKDGTGLNPNHFYGDLKNTVSNNSTTTVSGHARYSVSSITMKVYPPNSTTALYTFNASNTANISGSVTFNQTGEWRIVLTGGGLSSYTFTIRVV